MDRGGNMYKHEDKIQNRLEKSGISHILTEARATLNNPKRPETPELPRHLFSGQDYSNRPGSAYNVQNLIGTTLEDLNAELAAHEKQAENRIKVANKARVEIIPEEDDDYIQPNPPVVKKYKISKNKKKAKSNQEETSDLNREKDQDITADSKNIGKLEERIAKEHYARQFEQEELKINYGGVINEDHEEDDSFEQEDLEEYMERNILEDIEAQEHCVGLTEMSAEAGELDKCSKFLADVSAKLAEGKNNEERPKAKGLDDLEKMTMEYDLGYEEGKLRSSEYSKEFEDVMNLLCDLLSDLDLRGRPKPYQPPGEKTLSKSERSQIQSVCQRICVLAGERGGLGTNELENCKVETLIKGIICIMGIGDTGNVISVGRTIINCFGAIYHQAKMGFGGLGGFGGFGGETVTSIYIQNDELIYTFSSLLTAIKILFKLSKTSANDTYFLKNQLITELLSLTNIFTLEKDVLIKLTSKIVISGGKRIPIGNDMNVYDFLLYILAIIKNISSQKEKADFIVGCGWFEGIIQLVKLFTKKEMHTLKDKIPQVLVQISAIIRNFAHDTTLDFTPLLPLLIHLFAEYLKHVELVLNLTRIMSKLSLLPEYTEIMMGEESAQELFIEGLNYYKENPAIFIRIAFILGNMTMLFNSQPLYIFESQDSLLTIMKTTSFYLTKWDQKIQSGGVLENDTHIQNFDEFNKFFSSDVVVKSIRLFANLWISQMSAQYYLIHHSTDKDSQINGIINKLCNCIQLDTTEHMNEEFILNAISCISNILYYETNNSNIIVAAQRHMLVEKVVQLLEFSTHQEIRIESLRIICNSSRQTNILSKYRELNVIPILMKCMPSPNRDIRYYTFGALINLTADKLLREDLFGYNLDIIIKALSVSEFGELEISTLCCKLLTNICDSTSKSLWENSQLSTLDSILSPLGQECDEALEVCNPQERAIVEELHNVINTLINTLPDITYDCLVKGCGRKFPDQEKMEEHMNRRHPGVDSGEIN